MTKHNNIYYFYGNLALTVDRKVRAWRENFISKYGEHAIVSISLEETPPSVITSEFNTPPFLSNARLIIVRWGDFTHKEYANIEFWSAISKDISETTFVVFAHLSENYEGLIDFLRTSAQTKEFSLSSREEALEFIQSELPNISSRTQNVLYEAIGDNPLQLQSEVLKFALIPNIGDEEILHNLNTLPERKVFKSIDALLAGNPTEALTHLALKNCDNPFELFGEVLRALRKWVLYCALIESGMNSTLAGNALSLKEYPAKKYSALPSKVRQNLIQLYTILASGEADIKTGKIKIEGEGIEFFITKTFLDYHFSLIRR